MKWRPWPPRHSAQRSKLDCTDRYERWWRRLLRFMGIAPFAPGERNSDRVMVFREGNSRAGDAAYRPLSGTDQRLHPRERAALAPDLWLRLVTDRPTFSRIFAGRLRPPGAYWLSRAGADERTLAFAERLFPCWTPFRLGLASG